MVNLTNTEMKPPAKRASKIFLAGGIVLVCCLIGGFLLFRGFFSDTDKEAIQKLLQTRATSLSQKDLPRYLACFSPQYRNGKQTYNDLKTNASQWFTQFATIQFSFQIQDIQIQDKKAIIESNYKFSLTDREGESIHIAQKELLELKHESDGWKIINSLSVQ